jgi:DNA-directed RNA polymerase subunit RPC12/RpoP
MDNSSSFRHNESMDLSVGYNHGNDDDDIEGRDKPKVSYICGGNIAELKIIGCGKENKFDKDSVIRCMFCSHRIFYKKREKKIIQYLAR